MDPAAAAAMAGPVGDDPAAVAGTIPPPLAGAVPGSVGHRTKKKTKKLKGRNSK